MPEATIQHRKTAQRRDPFCDIQMLKDDVCKVEPLVAIHRRVRGRAARFLSATKNLEQLFPRPLIGPATDSIAKQMHPMMFIGKTSLGDRRQLIQRMRSASIR